MNSLVQSIMRRGAGLLLVVALIQFLVGLIPLVSRILSETGHMAQHHGYSPDYSGIPFGLELTMLFSAVANAAFPFFGALVIDRLDRWLDQRDKVEPSA
jgi:hypothetical protein